MKVRGIIEAALYVDDLTKAKDFYRQVLGLEVTGEEEGRHVFFLCGDGVLLLFNPRATSELDPGKTLAPPHGAFGSGHVAFPLLEDKIEDWRCHLEQNHIPIESEVSWPQGGYSIYFRDPAGNCLELVTPSIWALRNR